jgi:hypothetical protein
MNAPLVSIQRGRVLVMGLCLVVLATACLREAWTYYETRRFNQTVERIVARGEPTSRYQAERRPDGLADGVIEQNAAQYYIAAAELVLTRPEWMRANEALLTAARNGGLGDDASQRQGDAFVGENGDALRLVATARGLDFRGFNTSRRFDYAPIYRLPLLLGAAAHERIRQGDGDGSLALVADLLGTLRAFEPSSNQQSVIVDQAVVLTSLALQHTPPSPDALRLVRTALQTSTGDNALIRFLLSSRADFVGEVGQHLRTGEPLTDDNAVLAWLLRPWLRHRVNRHLGLFHELLSAAELPWRQRVPAMEALAGPRPDVATRSSQRGPLGRSERFFTSRGALPWSTRYVAHWVTLSTALDAAIATELFRHERGILPRELADLEEGSSFTDPMTGAMLRYRHDAAGYVLYGVGSDGTDDGGDFGSVSQYSATWQIAPDQSPDWGIRVNLPDD